MLDDTDRRILRHLRWPNPALSTRSGGAGGRDHRDLLAAAGKADGGGVVQGQQVIDWRRLGYEVEVSLRFTLDKTDPRAFDDFRRGARGALR